MKIKLMLLLVDVITPTNILFIGVANVDPSWRRSLCFYPNQNIAQRGWQMSTLHEDTNDDYDDDDDDDNDDDDDDHDDCKCGATSGLGRTCINHSQMGGLLLFYPQCYLLSHLHLQSPRNR